MADPQQTTPYEPRPNDGRARAFLPRWANNHDAWCRTTVADVLKTKAQPSDSDVDRYLKLLFLEKKLSEEIFEPVPKIEEKEFGAKPA